MTTATDSVARTVRECAEPILAAVDENLRDARRAAVAVRHQVEDCVADTAGQVRRHPFASLGIAAGVGTLVGCVIGFALARREYRG